MRLNRKFLFFPALASGIAILALAINFRPSVPVKPAENRAKSVEVMALNLQGFSPLITGFGKVAPKVDWKAIAEVSGKIVYRHPELEKGRVLLAGTEILRIDPLDYELKLAQSQADLSSTKAQLAKLDLEQSNIKSTLKIERNRLEISHKELKRKQELRKKRLTSQSDVDQQNQSLLAQKKVVQDLQNQLILLPDEKKVIQAQLKVNESRVEEAKRSLAKTSIRLPIDARISEIDIAQNQVVNLQQTMVVAHGIETMEVEAQFSIHDFQTLISSLAEYKASDDGRINVEQLGFNATIELSSGAFLAKWPASLTRISESVDPNQATVGVILEVSQDYSKLKPGSLPPLVNGMFVEAKLIGQENPHWVIPEQALHGERIYIMTPENTLDIKRVKVLFRYDGKVAIDGELEQGSKLIINDLMPAIQNMELKEASAMKVVEVSA
ncbi:HlyD family secretion protein [Vibrio sp. Of7-15]|uniref:efflux RND transporter periplasmic adaptor subunit n=1 Tax=Vibrio sp. Of7-15 TaxID=2724879 RepID=UPI001EF1BEE2|nr:HlyD family secretion protein [Vibrio sp. Of7-15]MCG7498670.1 HlyD family secretion protein [Vibrio sp. Of7-15]